MEYTYGPDGNLPQYRDEHEHRARYWTAEGHPPLRNLIPHDQELPDPALYAVPGRRYAAPAVNGPHAPPLPVQHVNRPVYPPYGPEGGMQYQYEVPGPRGVAYDAALQYDNQPLLAPAPQRQYQFQAWQPAPPAPVHERALPPARPPAPRAARAPRAGNAAAPRTPAAPAGARRAPSAAAKTQSPIDAILQGLDDALEPNIDIPIVFPLIDNITGVETSDTLRLSSALPSSAFRDRICQAMGVNNGTSLGFKTSRDKVSDKPRLFNTETHVRNAILSITGIKTTARSKPVELHVVNLAVLAAAAESSAKGGKKKSGPVAGSIAAVTETQRRLEAHLLCINRKCPTPGVGGKNKFCFVGKDGVHIYVDAALRFYWAQEMEQNPENVDMRNPPNCKAFDALKQKIKKRALSPEAASSSTVPKKRRVFGDLSQPFDLTLSSDPIDLTLSSDDDIKVKVEVKVEVKAEDI
ncbi:hypothetical protein EXIGLDRAFT_769276 [Exidia glandulosa HHB12029]|uniref:Uncharacterized protein n=1 Tax=Exidia glandulosa HHB12029 TaxID=1314781 RepID=A0A165HK06_EXIGL|nr:hypothetical protein EXIGLDRAFT_769276 [Exidia glandulosa HHB12029]